MPARGITGVTPELLSVLRHEMTHSFVHFRAKGRAPTWLHEGLAQLEEGKTAAPVASALTGAYAAREELRADYPRLESDLADWLKRRAR